MDINSILGLLKGKQKKTEVEIENPSAKYYPKEAGFVGEAYEPKSDNNSSLQNLLPLILAMSSKSNILSGILQTKNNSPAKREESDNTNSDNVVNNAESATQNKVEQKQLLLELLSKFRN